ncbi:hypothetical protein ABIF26_008254 [Bradyrhizobium elkanii]|uniref:hypothetical protein n=1 Tax=Bradyrhizobium elkanii TaxID=29448 RepID=UPI0035156E71
MSRWPHTTYTWRRCKLTLAQLLVISLGKGDHTASFTARLLEVAEEIEEFRELYYPAPRRLEQARKEG